METEDALDAHPRGNVAFPRLFLLADGSLTVECLVEQPIEWQQRDTSKLTPREKFLLDLDDE